MYRRLLVLFHCGANGGLESFFASRRVTDSAGHLRVWERWLTKGALIGEGQLAPDGRLELTFTPEAGGGRLTLERAPLRPGRYGGNPSATSP